MECSRVCDAVHAYLDDELDPLSSQTVDAHLAHCPACRETYDQQRALKSVIREHADYYHAPRRLAERIRAKTGGAPLREPTVQHPRWRWMQFGGAMAAAMAVTWMAALHYATPADNERLADEVIAGHARAIIASRVTDVASSDQHTVKPWLSGRLDYSPSVVNLASRGYTLVGGRLDYLDRRPVAALVYQRREHVIDLYVWPVRAGEAPEASTLSRQGYHLLHWQHGDMAYWAISDLNLDELREFQRLYTAGL